MSHTPDPDPDSLQAPPSDRWWAVISLTVLLLVSLWAGVLSYRLLKIPPPPTTRVDHGPLPASVHAQVLATLSMDLKDVKFEERWEGGSRDFFVMGTPKPEYAKPFSDAFKADVADKLLPLLRPYGETVTFQIYNFDFAPVRLRPLPKEPAPAKD